MGWVIGLLVMTNVMMYFVAKNLWGRLKSEREALSTLGKHASNLQGMLNAIGVGIDYTAQHAVEEMAEEIADDCGVDNIRKIQALNRAFVRGICSIAVLNAETRESLTERGWVAAMRALERKPSLEQATGGPRIVRR